MKARTWYFLAATASFLFGTNKPVFSAASEPAVILEQKDEWQNFWGLPYYHVTGHVKNVSDKPIKYVKFELEFLDKDGKVIAHQVGYNQKAQFLVKDKEATGEGAIEPIGPGDKDYFGVGMTKESDLPKKTRFTSYCLKIAAAPWVDGKGEAPKSLKFTPKCLKIEEGKPAVPGEKRLNINTATEEDLMKLPNMTTARARAILFYRKSHGDLIQLRELQMIPQVSPILDQIKEKLALD